VKWKHNSGFDYFFLFNAAPLCNFQVPITIAEFKLAYKRMNQFIMNPSNRHVLNTSKYFPITDNTLQEKTAITVQSRSGQIYPHRKTGRENDSDKLALRLKAAIK